VVVSSETPLIAARCLVNQPGIGLQALLDQRRRFSSSLPGWTARPRRPRRGRRSGCTWSASPPSSRIMLGVPPSPHWKILSVFPILFQRLALDGEDRHAGRGDRGGGMVLGREDVAGGPADIGAEFRQRLDQHGGLDGHVQRAGDARALERLLVPNSSRQAIRPGISVSAIVISLRPQPASRCRRPHNPCYPSWQCSDANVSVLRRRECARAENRRVEGRELPA
jgi:hypothetical protein